MAILKQFFPDGKTFRHPKSRPSLTVLGICSTDKKKAMFELVKSEAEKIRFLNPEISVSEINLQNKNFWTEFNKFCICDLHKAFDTDFALIVQFDGRILNPYAWTDEFFNYDYIGAPWRDKVVGNGGFSLRSKKLCEFVGRELGTEWNNKFAKYVNVNTNGHEDLFYCRHERKLLENKEFRFAPFEVAKTFSVEHGEYSGQFGAHNSFSMEGRRYNLKTISESDFQSVFQKILDKFKMDGKSWK